jgi:hypothetical protein
MESVSFPPLTEILDPRLKATDITVDGSTVGSAALRLSEEYIRRTATARTARTVRTAEREEPCHGRRNNASDCA